MNTVPPIASPLPDDALAHTLLRLLQLLHPTDLRSGDVIFLLERFWDHQARWDRQARIARNFPSPGPATETALRWFDNEALLNGLRPAAPSGQLEALVEDVVATVGVVLRERREGLLDDLLAAVAEQTSRHGCPEYLDAIADALVEAIAA